MKTRFLIIFGIFTLTSLVSFYDVYGLTINKPELNKSNCELFAFEQYSNNFEFRDKIQTILDECVEKELITNEDIEFLQSPHRGISSREFAHVYSITNGDVRKVIQIIQDPNYPKNIFDPIFKAYEDLNNRLVVEPEFAKLLQTEVVGFGVDEQNSGIFITVDPKYANQENFDKYEEIFRETIGDVKITFEVNKRADLDDKSDFDFRILVFVVIGVSLSILLYYFWRNKKWKLDFHRLTL